MRPKFFANGAELRKWFEKNHDKEKELWLGFYKTTSGKPSVTWPGSVDQAYVLDGLMEFVNRLEKIVMLFDSLHENLVVFGVLLT